MLFAKSSKKLLGADQQLYGGATFDEDVRRACGGTYSVMQHNQRRGALRLLVTPPEEPVDPAELGEYGVGAPSGQLGLHFSGTRIKNVKPSSPLLGKVREGDVFVSVNGTQITEENLLDALKAADDGWNERSLKFRRAPNDELFEVWLPTQACALAEDASFRAGGARVKEGSTVRVLPASDVELIVLAHAGGNDEAMRFTDAMGAMCGLDNGPFSVVEHDASLGRLKLQYYVAVDLGHIGVQYSAKAIWFPAAACVQLADGEPPEGGWQVT